MPLFALGAEQRIALVFRYMKKWAKDNVGAYIPERRFSGSGAKGP
jgi:hypothetical protein